MSDLNKLNDFDRGEFDALHGYPCRECETEQYYLGYGTQYAKDQNATWYSERQFEEILGGA